MNEQIEKLLSKIQPQEVDHNAVAKEALKAFHDELYRQAGNCLIDADDVAKAIATITANVAVILVRMRREMDDHFDEQELLRDFTEMVMFRTLNAMSVARQKIEGGKPDD